MGNKICLTCCVPLHLDRISTFAEFVESHHCERVTSIHLKLTHLSKIVMKMMVTVLTMVMVMVMVMVMGMVMMITVNSEALWGKTSTKR